MKVGLPIDAMERLAAGGAAARAPLVSHILKGVTPGVDPLPAVLTLGRMPFDLAVEPLLDVLRSDVDPLFRSAAAWFLARHGAPAMDPLAGLVERGRGSARFWGAIGLGHTGLPEALRTLRGLLEFPELAVPAALALANSRDLEAIPRIHQAYLDVPDRSCQNILYEVMLDGCRAPKDGSPSSPWYVLWRRRPEMRWLPRLGSTEAGVFAGWLEPGLLPGGMKWPKKGLQRYATGRMELNIPEDIYQCESCGLVRIPLMGARECPETAFRSSLRAESVLRASLNSGGSTIAEALDALDGIARKLGKRCFSTYNEFRQGWMAVRNNLEELMSDGLRSADQALAALHASRARLDEAFGLPMASLVNAPLRDAERRLAAGEAVTELPELRMPKLGGPCPCGSGRPMQSCCRLLN